MIIMIDGNDADLRLRDLRTLNVVLRERNLTRAAQTLGTTQPSVSKVLARLRMHFGDPLVIRNGNARDGHPMQLTPRAAEMADPLRNLLVASDGLCASAPSFNPRTSDRTFKVLVSDVGTVLFLPSLVTRIAGEGGRLSLRAVPLDSRHFELKLESGEADLALGAFAGAPRGLKRQRLYFDNYLSVARRDHPKRTRLRSPAEFRAANHIIVTASDVGHAAHHITQQVLESEISPERVLFRLPSFIVAAIVASQTDAIATLPARVAIFLAEHLNLITFAPAVPLPSFEIAQYWHERYHRDPGHRWFRTACFDLFAKSRPQRSWVAAQHSRRERARHRVADQ
jgi:DNA-binding transcriptional LysR family regulator